MAPSTDRQVINTISDHSILGNIAVYTVVAVGRYRVVGNTTKTRIARIQSGRFLIQVRIREAEQQAVRVLMLERRLESIGLGMAEVSVAQQEIAQCRKTVT